MQALLQLRDQRTERFSVSVAAGSMCFIPIGTTLTAKTERSRVEGGTTGDRRTERRGHPHSRGHGDTAYDMSSSAS
ncbi:hypothetical protein EYF80_014838 [Liparis tanakae]|uniref:Uncharacterized protein n=1 Tax=Liparis tanakae TaxID=230148 RepID=A0A4Z2IAL4_9TELE|nr:hypothetical protein EYF80_014838 [Liparis tanakae]